MTASIKSSNNSVAVEKQTSPPKLRIKLKSYEVKMLEAAMVKIIGLLAKSGASYVGPIPLPNKRRLYTVMKSHFKYKDAREQYERVTHTKFIDVTELGQNTVEWLQNVVIPVGVHIEVKMF